MDDGYANRDGLLPKKMNFYFDFNDFQALIFDKTLTEPNIFNWAANQFMLI